MEIYTRDLRIKWYRYLLSYTHFAINLLRGRRTSDGDGRFGRRWEYSNGRGWRGVVVKTAAKGQSYLRPDHSHSTPSPSPSLPPLPHWRRAGSVLALASNRLVADRSTDSSFLVNIRSIELH